ncbi:MAG: cytochrome P450 [Myxococcaceae bacterium]
MARRGVVARWTSDIRAMRADALELFLRPVREGRDIQELQFGPKRILLAVHPDGVRHVLQENARNYTKQTPGFDVVRELLGQGLLTSDGEFWLRQRRLVQPAFHRAHLAAFGPLMVDCAETQVAEWLTDAQRRASVDVAEGCAKMALRIASRALFGIDVADQADEIGVALACVLSSGRDRMMRLVRFPLWLPTPAHQRLAQAVRSLEQVVTRIVDSRRGQEGTGSDVLSRLLAARDEDGQGMSPKQVRDEILTLLLAGHETTANALAWTLGLLSRHPDTRRRLSDEVRAVLGERPATVEDVPQLEFTRRVLAEALRLFPPAWIFSRAPIAKDTVCGTDVNPGDIIVVSPYVTHRDPRFWEDPEGFDPDRFATPPARFAYFPFGGGPRLCVGQNFAEQELALALVTVVRRAQLDLLPGARLVPEPAITLRPRGGLRMSVTSVRG